MLASGPLEIPPSRYAVRPIVATAASVIGSGRLPGTKTAIVARLKESICLLVPDGVEPPKTNRRPPISLPMAWASGAGR